MASEICYDACQWYQTLCPTSSAGRSAGCRRKVNLCMSVACETRGGGWHQDHPWPVRVPSLTAGQPLPLSSENMYQHLLVRQSLCLSLFSISPFSFSGNTDRHLASRCHFERRRRIRPLVWQCDSMNSIYCQYSISGLDPSSTGHEIFIPNSKMSVMNTVQHGPLLNPGRQQQQQHVWMEPQQCREW